MGNAILAMALAAVMPAKQVGPSACIDQCMSNMQRCHADAERRGKTADKHAMCACETAACECIAKSCDAPCPVRMWCR